MHYKLKVYKEIENELKRAVDFMNNLSKKNGKNIHVSIVTTEEPPEYDGPRLSEVDEFYYSSERRAIYDHYQDLLSNILHLYYDYPLYNQSGTSLKMRNLVKQAILDICDFEFKMDFSGYNQQIYVNTPFTFAEPFITAFKEIAYEKLDEEMEKPPFEFLSNSTPDKYISAMIHCDILQNTEKREWEFDENKAYYDFSIIQPYPVSQYLHDIGHSIKDQSGNDVTLDKNEWYTIIENKLSGTGMLEKYPENMALFNRLKEHYEPWNGDLFKQIDRSAKKSPT